MSKKKKSPFKYIPHGLSLLTAILLWFFVSNINNTIKTASGGIILKNLPSYLNVKEISTTTAFCSLRGSHELLSGNLLSQIHFSVDIKNPKPGSNTYPVKIDKSTYIPSGVTVMDIKPKTITVFFENQTTVSNFEEIIK